MRLLFDLRLPGYTSSSLETLTRLRSLRTHSILSATTIQLKTVRSYFTHAIKVTTHKLPGRRAGYTAAMDA